MLLISLLAMCAQALELASPTGNAALPHPTFKKFGRLTFKLQGGLLGTDKALEIEDDSIVWREKSGNSPLQMQRAILSSVERVELLRQVEKARLWGIGGTFRESNIFDAYTETLIWSSGGTKDEVLARVEVVGAVAPRGYKEFKRYLMELKERTFPSKLPRPIAKSAPVFRGLVFRFATPDAGFGPEKTKTFSISVYPPGHILPRFSSRLDEKDKRADAVLNPEEIDELVQKINAVPWEDIAGTYTHGFPPQVNPDRIAVSFDEGEGKRTIEVSGLTNAPTSYRELEAFLRALIAQHFKPEQKE